MGLELCLFYARLQIVHARTLITQIGAQSHRWEQVSRAQRVD